EALQELLAGGGEGLLGPPSAALQAATGRLEVLLALTAGYALVIAGRALEGRLPGLAAIEAAVGRRDADPQSPARLFALLLRVDPDRAAAARGERFCREGLAATDTEGLDRTGAPPTAPPRAGASASAGRSWPPPTSRASTAPGRTRRPCPPPRSWTCPAAGWSGCGRSGAPRSTSTRACAPCWRPRRPGRPGRPGRPNRARSGTA